MARMRITKFGHACVRIEHDGTTVVLDPGVFTDPEAVDGADAVLITHEHADHYAPTTCARPTRRSSRSTRSRRRSARTPPTWPSGSPWSRRARAFDAGLPVRAVGEMHAVIHPEFPRLFNSGYVVTAGDHGGLPPRRLADRARRGDRRTARPVVGAVAARRPRRSTSPAP